MLSESVKSRITSISQSDLLKLFEEYLQEHGGHGEEQFVTHLFNTRLISTAEFKSIQAEEKVELTSIANVEDIAEFDIEQLKDGPDEEDDYTILESIDRGAMGEILIARDNKLRRTVAYKRIHPHVAEIPSYLGRFYMEAQVTAQLQHPSIVPVYGLMVKDNIVGYAMKLIDGITLKALLQETMKQYDEKGEPDEHHTLHARLEHFLKVCDAMHYAHRKGVIHRDLKPLNIMVGPYNEVYVMDWGIAKTIEVDRKTFDDKTERVGADRTDKSDKTMLGQVMGTPAYMSPEQAHGENDTLDHRSDLYSLGLILFELVTFHRARSGKTVDEIMVKARQGIIDPPPAYSKQADAQEQLMAIINKATQYLPEDRYNTVAEFADDIRRFMHGEAIHARPESLRQKAMRWMTHHRIAAVNIMAYTILVAFIFLSVIFYQQMETMRLSKLESEKTGIFITNVSAKAQEIDAELLRYEAILEGLATGATNLLNQGTPDTSPYYTDLTIAGTDTGPPDYAFSEIYGFPVSVDWHVFKLAPGVDEKQVEPILRKLNPLRHTFKPLMLKSHHTPVPPSDHDTARQLIMNQGLPLVWLYVGLEEGIIAEYPGKTGYPAAYDPRLRPWYRGSIGQAGASWLQPYIDVGGRGVLLPCTSPLFDLNGKLMGVAGVELTLEYVRKQLLPMYNIPGIEKTYLLNDQGEIIVTSSDKTQSYGLGTLINSIDDLEVYPRQNVVSKILQGGSGQHRYTENGRSKMLAYYRLNSLGWYFLAEADERELLAASGL
jgi:serine/threonine-protein kinase